MKTPAAGFLLGFESATDQVRDEALPWSGEPPPAWLEGLVLIRNGPAQFDLTRAGYRHWFDGLAMLERFELRDGTFSYTNAFLASRDYLRSNTAGTPQFTEFGTAPHRGLARRLATALVPSRLFGDNASVHVLPAGDEWWAIWDVPRAMRFDGRDLATLGPRPEGHRLRVVLRTPHPVYDPIRAEWVNVGLGVTWRGPAYTILRSREPAMEVERVCSVPTDRPAYMHSFALSEHFVVITEHPFGPTIGGALALVAGSRPLVDTCQWRSGLPTRLIVVDRVLARVVAEIETDPMAVLHHVNAWEDAAGRLVVDVCAFEDAAVLDALFLDRLRSPGGGDLPRAQLRRYRLDLAQGTASHDVVSDLPFEMPRFDERCSGTENRLAYGVTMHRPDDFNDALARVDLSTGATSTWFEAGCYPGEPVVVPRPGGNEDDGVLLSLTLDAERRRSVLLVLDSATMEEIGRATLPHLVPHGLHGRAVFPTVPAGAPSPRAGAGA